MQLIVKMLRVRVKITRELLICQTLNLNQKLKDCFIETLDVVMVGAVPFISCERHGRLYVIRRLDWRRWQSDDTSILEATS